MDFHKQTQRELQVQVQAQTQPQQLYHEYQQQQPSASFALSSDDYNQIMMASIGSVLPSRNSIVGFMNNPDGLLAMGNTSGIFDICGEHTRNHSSSSFSNIFEPQNNFQNNYQNAVFQQQHPNLSQSQTQQLSQLSNISDFSQQQTQLNHSGFPQQHSGANTGTQTHSVMDKATTEYGTATRTAISHTSTGTVLIPNIAEESTSRDINLTQAAPSTTYSRADPFSLPDPFAAPIDDDIFADLQPIQPKTKRRMESSKTVTPTPTMSTTIAAAPVASPTPAPSLLHQACYLYPTTLAVVNSALGVEKSNLRRRVPTPAPPPPDLNNPNKRHKRLESFSLPLHIAIDRNASTEVLRALVEMAPDVIAMTDGPDASNAISALLQKKCRKLDVISMVVKANPDALKIVDRHDNTSLHVACAQGAPLDIVELIYAAYPDAMYTKNFHGQNPLDVAQRTNVCPLDVIDFIQQLVSNSLESNAAHLVDSEDEGFQ
jgi:hypothetical protein